MIREGSLPAVKRPSLSLHLYHHVLDIYSFYQPITMRKSILWNNLAKEPLRACELSANSSKFAFLLEKVSTYANIQGVAGVDIILTQIIMFHSEITLDLVRVLVHGQSEAHASNLGCVKSTATNTSE